MRFARLLPYLGCSFAIGSFYGFSNFSLPLWLGGYFSSYALISLLANTRNFLGSIVSPLTGAWSDRVWTGWLGRRRPFILGGGLLSALLVVLMPHVSRQQFADSWGLPPAAAAAAPLVLIIFLTTITINMMDDIQKSLLADLTEGAARNKLSSLGTVTDMGGNFTALALGSLLSSWLGGGVPDATFAVIGALVAVGVLITVLGIREPAPAVWAADRQREAVLIGPRLTLRAVLTHYRSAVVLGLVVFSYWFGVNAVLPLVTLYVKNILRVDEAEAQFLPGLLLLSTTLAAVPVGVLGTRLGKRRMIAAGYVIMILAALAGLVITTREQGAALFLLAGIGNAASVVLTIPLLADLVPRHHMGAAAGLLAAASGLAAPLSSLVAGTLADLYGERAIFAVMAAMVLVALGLLGAVHEPAAAAPAELSGEYA